MGCLGIHFAITAQEVATLKAIADEQERLEHLKETIEEAYFDEFREFMAESDKAWDAMHRALTDGKLSWDGGSYPLNHAVLGGELLYTSSDYIMSLKDPKQVRAISNALGFIDEKEFRRRYFEIDATGYGFDLTEEDLGYTWEWFQNVRDLYVKAAAHGRYVLFSADQ